MIIGRYGVFYSVIFNLAGPGYFVSYCYKTSFYDIIYFLLPFGISSVTRLFYLSLISIVRRTTYIMDSDDGGPINMSTIARD